MILNLPVEDLLVSQLLITLGSADGRLLCNIKPNFRQNHPTAQNLGCTGITLNLESVLGDNGYLLKLYASDDSDASTPPPSSTPSVSINRIGDTASADEGGMRDLLDDCTMSAISPDHLSALSHSMSSDESCRSSHGPNPSSNAYAYELCGDPSSEFGFAPMSTEMSCHYDAEKEFGQIELPRIARDDTIMLPTVPTSDYVEQQTLSPLLFLSPETQNLPPIPESTMSTGVAAYAISSAETSRCTSPSSTHALLNSLNTPPPSEPNSSPRSSTKSAGDEPKTARRAAQYPCLNPGCDRVLTSLYTRQVHMGTHRPKVRKTFLCTFGCGEAFTRQHDRQRHEVALHERQCQHVCARCKKFFSSEKMLDRHVCRRLRQGGIQWPSTGTSSLTEEP